MPTTARISAPLSAASAGHASVKRTSSPTPLRMTDASIGLMIGPPWPGGDPAGCAAHCTGLSACTLDLGQNRAGIRRSRRGRQWHVGVKLGGGHVFESRHKLNSETKQSGLIPALTWLRRYPGQWLRADVTAGLIAAAVVIPKAMAFATIAGLPVQVGLYTAFVPMVIYALLGTSRPLSVSTTTTIAILAAASLGEAVPNGGARGAGDRRRHLGNLGWRHAAAGVAAPSRLYRQLHFGSSPGRVQDRGSGW